MTALVVVDADVLGRRRTGDETYVLNLLRHLPAAAGGRLRFAALTRRPELVPEGVEAIHVPARLQELRMAWSVPRTLAAAPPGARALPARAPAALPVPGGRHDPRPLVRARSFRDAACTTALSSRPLCRARRRRAAHVLAVSERTKEDLVELYGIPPDEDHRHAARRRSRVLAGWRKSRRRTCCSWRSVEKRKNPLAAADAAREVGLPLVVAGPVRDAELARELERRGAQLRGYVTQKELVELYRGAACLVHAVPLRGFRPAGARGDGLRDARRRRAGCLRCARWPVRPRSSSSRNGSADGVRQALADRERLVAAGLERARQLHLGGDRAAHGRRVPARCLRHESLRRRRQSTTTERSSASRCLRSCRRWTRLS